MIKKKYVTAIILCRISSTRLKNKMLMKIDNRHILEIFIHRLLKSKLIDNFVLATTTNVNDDILAKIAKKLNIVVFRGSEDNVLERMMGSLQILKHKTDIVVRANADNPLIMPNIIDEGIVQLEKRNYDMISPFYFNTLPFGVSSVVFRYSTLLDIYAKAKSDSHKEHVETYCFDNSRFYRNGIHHSDENTHFPNVNLTLDYIEDFNRIRNLYFKINKYKIYSQSNKLFKYISNNKIFILINNDEYLGSISNSLKLIKKKFNIFLFFKNKIFLYNNSSKNKLLINKNILGKIINNNKENIFLSTFKHRYLDNVKNQYLFYQYRQSINIKFNNDYCFFKEEKITKLKMNIYLLRYLSVFHNIFSASNPRQSLMFENRILNPTKFVKNYFFSQQKYYFFPKYVYLNSSQILKLNTTQLDELNFAKTIKIFDSNDKVLNNYINLNKYLSKNHISNIDVLIIKDNKFYNISRKSLQYVGDINDSSIHFLWHSHRYDLKRISYINEYN